MHRNRHEASLLQVFLSGVIIADSTVMPWA
jgi:hypothetical protein